MIVIDRFEGEIAVLETDAGFCRVARCKLPPQAREGDLLRIQDGRYLVDEEGTKARAARIKKLMDDLFE